MPGLFVTGTDTGVGKTLVSAGLIVALQRQGVEVMAMKPVAAGCHYVAGQLRNEDAEQFHSLLNCQTDYSTINPCALEAAAAPHIVAAEQGQRIDVDGLAAAIRVQSEQRFTLVEGAGGWRVPLAGHEDVGTLALRSNLPVLLVVGIRLGCINHALLSAEAILNDGANLLGWVASDLEPEDTRLDAQVAALDERMPAPRLGRLPAFAQPSPSLAAEYLDVSSLMELIEALKNPI
ncbi:dethiobiotin synthase [Halorhodospira halochloris]|uniref:ATP-dependent dethiobiotin synthetase BioD n=1 Tax=Halorhodospira halochloris TaxID=1052 RepID=A0A0X8X6I2_HALHR|nr:dethiobiotin synthase [Halorhodospira halochloris]MBK1651055.1 dethiobiotin synthase [Halorhodospira halochloris]MCG5529414.1 dethiobiotin synthase [Halorhodospira halochloris]BAU56431.1 dethiobiotin synthetase [Halorhodospira halochloris]